MSLQKSMVSQHRRQDVEIQVQSKYKLQNVSEMWYNCLNRAANHDLKTVSVDSKKKVKLSMLQAVNAHRVVRHQGSHIF
jgi:hypothetical protein